MQHRRTSLIVAAALVAAACSKPGGAGGAASTSKHGLSVEVRAAADRLRQFIGEKLGQAEDKGSFNEQAAEARRQLLELRSKNQNDSDLKVTLLLQLLLAKDRERKALVFQSRQGADSETVRGEIASLYEGRERCNDEILAWLEYTPTDRAALESGRCLAEAQRAAGKLGEH